MNSNSGGGSTVWNHYLVERNVWLTESSLSLQFGRAATLFHSFLNRALFQEMPGGKRSLLQFGRATTLCEPSGTHVLDERYLSVIYVMGASISLPTLQLFYTRGTTLLLVCYVYCRGRYLHCLFLSYTFFSSPILLLKVHTLG